MLHTKNLKSIFLILSLTLITATPALGVCAAERD
jgi:hypothetical protein